MVYYHRLIKEVYENMTKQEYKKEAYWCNKCKRFHNPKFKKQPSITHLEHFCYFYKYKSDYTQAELFKISFKESWKREGKRIEKNKLKSIYIN